MTDHTNAELIADARQLIRHSSVSAPEHANMLDRLADALEAVVQERDNWKMSAEEAERAEKRADQRAVQAEAELRDAFRTDIPSLKDQRDALAAVVEKVRAVIHGPSGLSINEEKVWQIVNSATAPADALREHDAKVREDLWHAYWSHNSYERMIRGDHTPVTRAEFNHLIAKVRAEEPSDAEVLEASLTFERVWDEIIDSFDPERDDGITYIQAAMRAALIAAQEVRYGS